MLSSILPETVYSAISKLPFNTLNEIRLRVGKKIVVCLAGKSYYLSANGLSNNNEGIYVDRQMIEYVIKQATEYSLYALNNQIKQGFISLQGGIRIGLAGEVVFENKILKTIKNCSSLNIRVPHEVKNCSLNAFNYILKENFHNTLILSPPGCGKTTFIRDLVYQLSNHNYCYNVLIADERFEIASVTNGEPQLNVGEFTDVYSGCTKSFAFENGIRSLRPDIIVTDEIATEKDVEAINYASACGVGVLASAHCENIAEFKRKPYFEELIKNKVFKRIVVLSNKKGPGTYEGIYDENLSFIYF